MIRSMVKVGAFPHQKGIGDFEFAFQPSINEQEIRDFRHSDFWKPLKTSYF